MGGCCQRLITAVCSTYRRVDRKWETERGRAGETHTHINRCTVMHSCIYFQLKLLVASFISYVMHMGKSRLQSPTCKFPWAQTIHWHSRCQLRCKVTNPQLIHTHRHTLLLNIHWSGGNEWESTMNYGSYSNGWLTPLITGMLMWLGNKWLSALLEWGKEQKRRNSQYNPESFTWRKVMRRKTEKTREQWSFQFGNCPMSWNNSFNYHLHH